MFEFTYKNIVLPMFILKSDRLMKVYNFASHAHEFRFTDGTPPHRRKYSGAAYIVHPIEVAKILWDAGVRDENLLSAALLHDVIEDTSAKPVEVANLTNARTLMLVLGLTDVSKPC